MIEIGKKAPSFCLPSLSSEKDCLDDFRSRWVVLYFYPKDDTSG